jgi:hypothetical protein
MAVPTSYLTTTKNLGKILAAIQNAQAPKQFTTRFLASLGFPSAGDRLIIAVLKSLGFLTAEGAPTKRYFEYLDQTQSKRVMADGIREAYGDLFQINRKAYELSSTEIKNKLKTITQGQVGDSVLDKMAATFKAAAQHADFNASAPGEKAIVATEPATAQPTAPEPITPHVASDTGTRTVSLGGLVYNIQLILPADRDQAVYDALFRSLKEHLF